MAPITSFTPPLAPRLKPFGTTIFAEMSALAKASGAINLSQGFPNFEGPEALRLAAKEAIDSGLNQYARSMGHIPLVEAIAAKTKAHYGLDVDPLKEIGVVTGATEGIAAAILGIVSPGDDVILFEPYYDSYRAMVTLAGGTPRYVTLKAPGFEVDLDALKGVISRKTRLLILNTPHNPTGKVFSQDELLAIGTLCKEMGIYILTDEVYEHITFDGLPHIPLATLPGMWDHTLTLSSAGKSYSATGWKVGYAIGPEPLVSAMQSAHQFLTFSTATPLQAGLVPAFELGMDFYDALQRDYQRKRDILVEGLTSAGLEAITPQGTYFVLVDIQSAGFEDDRLFARFMTQTIGVACIPCSAFYTQGVEEGRRLVRFAFCKDDQTLKAASGRLQDLRRRREGR